MSEILSDQNIRTLLDDLCDVDGLRKRTKAEGIAESHAALRSRLSALEGENARLREALRPFAAVAPCLDDDESDTMLVLHWRWNSANAKLVNGDFRRADAALSPSSPAAGETGETEEARRG